jgi:hypothetical protein
LHEFRILWQVERGRLTGIFGLYKPYPPGVATPAGKAGSEDDADEGGDRQHEDRRDGEKPKHPDVPWASIGGFMVVKQRGHRGLP